MSAAFVTHLILQYRYWILIPLSFIEGPIVAFVAGSLAAAGIFNIYFLAVLFFVRDVGLDGVYYSIGYFGGHSHFAQKMLKKIGVTENHLGKLRELWTRRPIITMFVGKLSYGVASAFIVVAGMVKMPLRVFFKYGIVVAIIEYGGFLLAGYYLGVSFGGSAENIIRNVQYIIGGVALVLGLYFFISWRMREKFLNADKKIEELPL